MYLPWHHLDPGKAAVTRLLADEFEVSRPAMEFRLRDSGLVLPTGLQAL